MKSFIEPFLLKKLLAFYFNMNSKLNFTCMIIQKSTKGHHLTTSTASIPRVTADITVSFSKSESTPSANSGLYSGCFVTDFRVFLYDLLLFHYSRRIHFLKGLIKTTFFFIIIKFKLRSMTERTR